MNALKNIPAKTKLLKFSHFPTPLFFNETQNAVIFERDHFFNSLFFDSVVSFLIHLYTRRVDTKQMVTLSLYSIQYKIIYRQNIQQRPPLGANIFIPLLV